VRVKRRSLNFEEKMLSPYEKKMESSVEDGKTRVKNTMGVRFSILKRRQRKRGKEKYRPQGRGKVEKVHELTCKRMTVPEKIRFASGRNQRENFFFTKKKCRARDQRKERVKVHNAG